MVERLSLAQVMTLGSWDQVPYQDPRGEPASSSAYVTVSLMNKQNLKKKKSLHLAPTHLLCMLIIPPNFLKAVVHLLTFSVIQIL